MQKVRKAVIPCAGLGTRFLPATKAVPKELLPIVDIPTIQLIVEEAANSGIETVILVTGRGKGAIEDHFDEHSELEAKLEHDKKEDLLQLLRSTIQPVKIITIRQGVPRGLGHAVLCAQEVVGEEPFAVLLGDDLVDHTTPCTKQMIDVYEKHGRSVVALLEIAQKDVSKFGICAGKALSDREFTLDKMVEKPKPADAPSNLAIAGRYVLTPQIFRILAATKPGAGGEIQLTDAMAQLMKTEGFIGYRFLGRRYDAGDKFGFLQATIAYALKRPELRPALIEFMREVVKNPEAMK